MVIIRLKLPGSSMTGRLDASLVSVDTRIRSIFEQVSLQLRQVAESEVYP